MRPSNQVSRGWNLRRGFTFVEILAAMLFMAIVIPVAMKGIQLANRVGVAAERKRQAAQLADAELTQLVATDTWRTGNDGGDFGPDWPWYRWELTTEGWSEDAMRVLTMHVFYRVQEVEYSETLSTLVPETPEEQAPIL